MTFISFNHPIRDITSSRSSHAVLITPYGKPLKERHVNTKSGALLQHPCLLLCDYIPGRPSVRARISILPSTNHPTDVLHTGLLSKAKTRPATARLMDNVLALEEDITKDVKLNAIVGLNTTKAHTRRDGRIVDELAGHNLLNAANGNGKVRKVGRTGECVSTLGVIINGAADLCVVGRNNGIVDEDERGASVKDTVDRTASSRGPDAVSRGGEAPETAAVVHVDVGYGSSVLAGVDEPKVVSTGRMVLEGNSKEGLGELALNTVEPGLLLDRLNSVDRAEGQTEKTVGVSVLAEAARDGGSSLYGLRSGSDTTDGDLVSIHCS